MRLSSARIHKALMESLEDTVKEFERINSRHPLTPWDPATKMERMKPTSAQYAECKPPRDPEFKIHSYYDWKTNYRPQGISWEEYKNIEF